MLELTGSAVEALKSVLCDAGDDVCGIRIMVSVGGCSGLQYRMGLESAVEAGDEVIEAGGVKILVDAESLSWLNGAEIDFKDDGIEAGFVFNNPNALGRCSCGKSSAEAGGCSC
jgi:iron-sulfur cluster assembly protein